MKAKVDQLNLAKNETQENSGLQVSSGPLDRSRQAKLKWLVACPIMRGSSVALVGGARVPCRPPALSFRLKMISGCIAQFTTLGALEQGGACPSPQNHLDPV